MDTNQGGQGPLIAGVGGAALIILLFLPWASVNDVNASGWELFTIGDVFLLITGLVAIGAAVGAGGRLLPGLSLSGATALLGGIATILLLWLLIFDWFDGTSRMFWVFLALIAAAAIAFGGATAAQEDAPSRRG
ncbi:MAG TPA: hypothetical protein VK919_00340 [Solirubrobacterales bacterium]|nr:hypothetical protein [Solirubrobacterales bacterium]